MNNRIKLLEKMFTNKKDVLGDDHYTAYDYSFNEFKNVLGLEQENYEQLLKDMRHEDLVEIKLDSTNELVRSSIQATPAGMDYLINNKGKNKIGF